MIALQAHRMRALYIFFTVTCLMLPAAITSASATVNFEGYLFDGFSGVSFSGGSVIAGTFAPGFNPSDIACVYGDSICNVGAEFYTLGVTDGTIRPIGDFVITDGSGYFSGSGITNEPAGTPIYLFGFNPFNSYSAVLATSSHASYLVPAMDGTTSILATDADSFIFGNKVAQGIALNGTPIPEPTTLAPLLSLLFLYTRPPRRWRFS